MGDSGRPDAVVTTRADAAAEYLAGAHVAFELIEHEPVTSAGAEAQATGFSPEQVAKTVLLSDGRGYVCAAIPASHRLDLQKLRRLLHGSRRVQLASEEAISRDFPRFEVGAVPPFGPLVVAAEVVDQRLLDQPQILCPAGDRRHSVLVDPRAIVRITAALTADLCQD